MMFVGHEKMFVVYESSCYKNNALVIHGHLSVHYGQIFTVGKTNVTTNEMSVDCCREQISPIKTKPFGNYAFFLCGSDFSGSRLKRG